MLEVSGIGLAQSTVRRHAFGRLRTCGHERTLVRYSHRRKNRMHPSAKPR